MQTKLMAMSSLGGHRFLVFLNLPIPHLSGTLTRNVTTCGVRQSMFTKPLVPCIKLVLI